MIQTEAQRQFYLGVAGIRLWYAREPLPGAAPSPELQFPEVEEPEHLATPGVRGLPGKVKSVPLTSEASQQGVKRIASLQALMENKKEPAPSDPQELPSAAVVASTEGAGDGATVVPEATWSSGQALSLNMGVFFGAKHILIAHISKEASLRLQETLAANILRSLGEQQSLATEWVQWPVFNNRLVPGSALADLKSVMMQVLGGAGSKKVIVLGRLEGTGAGSGWLPDVLERVPEVEFEHSLALLASNPGSKRALWQQLKPLVSA